MRSRLPALALLAALLSACGGDPPTATRPDSTVVVPPPPPPDTTPAPPVRTLALVVADGNSLTSGTGTADPARESYPAQLAALLAPVPVVNVSISGQTSTDMAADAQDADAPLAAIAPLPANRVAVLLAWELRNDYVGNAAVGRAPTVDEALAHFAAYCQARRAAGYRVGVLPVLPSAQFNWTPDQAAAFEAWRLATNTRLASEWPTFADFYVSLPDALTAPGAEWDRRYYVDEGASAIHLAAPGAGLVAQAAATAVAAYLARP
jgi:lysophospholipase L1-like esterase